MTIADRDLQRYSNRYYFEGNATTKNTSPTGVVAGPLTNGRWIIYSDVRTYFKRGDSTLAVGDVLVDETTPSTSMPISAGAYIPIDVTGSTNNYIAFKSKSGGDTGIVALMPQAPIEGY